MINQNWWFPTLLTRQFKYCPPLNRSIKCDVLIVGGGMSGISAAVEFLQRGFSVVLIEKNIVGGSSSGRSAGFLTPDSELELHQLVRRYGIDAAREIWEMPCRGIDRIVQAIKRNGAPLACSHSPRRRSMQPEQLPIKGRGANMCSYGIQNSRRS